MKKALCLIVLATSLVSSLSGCASVSGLIDAGDDFGCPMHEGVACRSLSEVHAALHDEAPRRPDVIVERVEAKAATPAAVTAESKPTSIAVGRGKRRPEEVLVLTILPFVDADGDLHDTQNLWMRTQEAGWYVERLRRDALTATEDAR